jgi:outer membrane biosynthesis protein TonB
MSALAFDLFQRHERAFGRSFALSAFVHIALAAVLFLGVRWQSHAPDTVMVDLVEAPPPPPVEAPKPVPKLEPPPVVKPEPRVEKPQIVIREKPKPKPKPEVKPKSDPNFEKRLREQVALEQKALDQQRQERELRELIARKQAEATRAAAAARAIALAAWEGRIAAKIRSGIPEFALEGIPGTRLRCSMVLLPTNEVLRCACASRGATSATTRRSSGRSGRLLAAAAAAERGTFPARARTYLPSLGQIRKCVFSSA